MSTIQHLKRVFKVDNTLIDDPTPDQPLEVATRVLSQTYPQFRLSSLFEEDGVVVGDTLEFNLVVPPLKVNG